MKLSPLEITNILNGSDNKKIKNTVANIEADARSGDARANYMISKWYADGIYGFPKDKKKYKKHIREAMDKLLPEAIYDYGVSKDGKTDRRAKEAIAYYILASVLGDLDAIEALINHFIYGKILQKNDFVASALKIHRNYLESKEKLR